MSPGRGGLFTAASPTAHRAGLKQHGWGPCLCRKKGRYRKSQEGRERGGRVGEKRREKGGKEVGREEEENKKEKREKKEKR